LRFHVSFGIVISSAASAHADGSPRPVPVLAPSISPVSRLGQNIIEAFTGTNLIFHGAALASTGVFSWGGIDHEVFVFTQKHEGQGSMFSEATVVLGYVLPLTLAPVLYGTGLVSSSHELTGAGSAAVQALVVTVVTTGLLKWMTGRPFPYHGRDPRDPDRPNHPEYAHEYSFQLFRSTSIYAWPSGHTSASISIAAALTAYYPDSLWIPAIGYPIALLIGFWMINGSHHWASDVLAGGLMGHTIGYSIGQNFRRLAHPSSTATTPIKARSKQASINVVPLAGARLGLSVMGIF